MIESDLDIVEDDQGFKHTRECVERGWSVLDWTQECVRALGLDPETVEVTGG